MEADSEKLPEISSSSEGSLSSCGKQVRTPLGTSEIESDSWVPACEWARGGCWEPLPGETGTGSAKLSLSVCVPTVFCFCYVRKEKKKKATLE